MWVPQLLTDGQMKQRVKIARQYLKIFQNKKNANIVTGDETWVHYFESVRKVRNKICATRNSKRQVIAKRTLSAKKVLNSISFSDEGVAIQVTVKQGKCGTGK